MLSATAPAGASAVLTLSALARHEVDLLLRAYGAKLVEVAPHETIEGSYWGGSEAGLVGGTVYARADTPAHSFLHELCHYICMSADRRAALATDAGGSDDEECGVCYLQVLLAQRFRNFGAARCLEDMDAWGYTFREGSARAWFEGDGAHARAWLLEHALIDAHSRPTLSLR